MNARAFPLVVLPSLLLAVAPLTVLLAIDADLTLRIELSLLVVALLPALTPLALRAAGRRWDALLLSAAWVLCALGLAAIARVQPQALPRQLLWIVMGWFAFVAVAGFEPLLAWWRRDHWFWLAVALLLVLATFVIGVTPAGQEAHLWLRFGPILVQPVELLRVVLVVFLAAALSDGRLLQVSILARAAPVPKPDAAVLLLLAVVGLCAAAVILQGDFGPAVIFVASFVGMLYLALRKRDVFIASAVFAAVGIVAYAASARIQGRTAAWLDPWADPQGAGYQSLQAIGAFASGGVAGTGPGYGHPGLIPAAHTDYPLAVLGEEWGLLVTLAAVPVYALLVVRGLGRAVGTADRFGQLLGAGLALSLGVQVLVVLGGVLRLVPLAGLTTPFMSYGGSSMLMSWVILGLMVRAAEPDGVPESAQPLVSTWPQRVQRLGAVLIIGFGALTLALGWWHVVRADALAADTAVSGERMRLEGLRVTRGRILDRNGAVLAETILDPDGTKRRAYHQPGLAHVVGYDSPEIGVAGVEALADDTLMGRGAGGPERSVQDMLHQQRAGGDVRITLDLELQRIAERAMGGAVGAAVALDPRTGDVLALVSNPVFPSVFTQEDWRALRSDPSSPLLNRATQGLYPPGSTFKTVTLAAGVEHQLVRANGAAQCPASISVDGIPIANRNEPPGKRTRTVADALAYSCNTFFARLGIDLGEQRLVAMADAFGLTSAVPFDLPTSQGAISTNDDFLTGNSGLAVTAFGQGELQVTPLHLALVAAAVANGGEVPEPRLLLDSKPQTWRRAMSVETARAVTAMMEHAVQTGWANSAAIRGVRVAAKTGSAEVEPGANSHALFIAFAPVENPQIAVAVVKERAGSGSREAGPVAKALIEAWLSLERQRAVTSAR